MNSNQSPSVEIKTLAGVSTTVEIRYSKKWKVLVDTGPVFSKKLAKYSEIFLTHCHLDHCLSVFFIARLRAQMRLPPPNVYLPYESLRKFKDAKKYMGELDGETLQMTITGLSVKDDIGNGDEEDILYLFNGRLEVGWFKTFHRVPSLGYYFKRTGEYGCNDIIVTGDTGNKIFNSPKFKGLFSEGWERLITECTYFGDRQVKLAELSYHLCFNDIINNLELFGKVETLSLTHFSERHSINTILTEMKNKLPKEWLSRIHPDFSMMNWKDVEYRSEQTLIDLFKLFLNTEQQREPLTGSSKTPEEVAS